MDINIDNYNYSDLLNVFKISNNCNLENIDKMKLILNKIKNINQPDIINFFTKAYNIIYSIFHLHQNNSIDKIENFQLINNYCNKIKNIKNLENKKIDDIITIINEINMDTYANSYVKVLPTTKSLESLNNRSLYNNLETNTIQNTVNNSIAPGNINAIKRLTKSLNLNMNSCFRSNYFQSNSSDFQYVLPSEIKNVVSMRLISLELPNSLYLISKYNKNNLFEIIITTNNEKLNYIIEIPDGNYKEKELEDFLNKTYFYQSENDSLLKYIKFTIDKYNNKTSIEILNDDISISLIFSTEYNENPLITFGWLCGFRLTTYLNIQKCIISEGIFDNGSENYIYIIINDYQYNSNNLNIVGFDKSLLIENVIAKVPIKHNNYSLILKNDSSPLSQVREYNGPINISKLQFKLIDKFGTLLNFNNMDIGLTIEFEVLYESFNFNNITD
jgi:hypothetical protein